MHEDRSLPLVSLCIITYNQEKYVFDAIQSAFNQTYSPLEIIIADDCSTDATRDIIKPMVDAYRHKENLHRIFFQENRLNLGVAKNYEQVFSLAHGELVITGAGDDISLPNRVETIVKGWDEGGRLATVISHAAILIDEKGEKKGVQEAPSAEKPIGALMGYSKRVVSDFSPIISRNVFEDDVFAHRAIIIGNILKINQALVLYRVGTGLSTSGGYHARRKRVSTFCIRSNGQTWVDLKSKRDKLDGKRYKELEKLFHDYELMYRCEYRAHDSSNLCRKIKWGNLYNKSNGGWTFRKIFFLLSPDWLLLVLGWLVKKSKFSRRGGVSKEEV